MIHKTLLTFLQAGYNPVDKVYFPYTSIVDKSHGYRIASPAGSENNEHVFVIEYDGWIDCEYTSFSPGAFYCIRPVVSMDTNLIAENKATADANNMLIYYVGGNVND